MESGPARTGEELRDELLALVSHELRTPLTVIAGASRILNHHPAVSEQTGLRPVVDDLMVASRRMERVVEHMLLLSRLSEDAARAEPVLVRAAVNRAMRAHAEEFPSAQAAVLEGADPALVVEAVPAWLQLMLTNLLRNAYQYGDRSRPVLVQWYANENDGVIAICNANKREPIERERWFEPFFRSEPASTAIFGAGLGLPVARKLAEAQGGTVIARAWETEPGTKVEVRLPLVRA